ncbi:TPA: hypothetical protein PXM26_002071 [Yersinia enterocolitica]|nr:hypothetical protein [Yersinia enterocolitica]
MALTLLSANNASTVLSAGISASATTLAVNTGTGGIFPSPVSGTSFFKLTLIDAATGTLTEIVHVTARTGDTMTIVRGQEGTVSRLWSANDIAANMMTAGTLDLFAQAGSLGGAAQLNVGTTAGTVAAGNDSRINGALQKSANLSDLSSVPTALTNLGLSDVAHIPYVQTLGARMVSYLTAGAFTFTVPAEVTRIRARVVGGGGGAGGSAAAKSGGGGGAGGYSEDWITVTAGQVLSITVGANGAGGTTGNAGTAGSVSSVSGYLSASGGAFGDAGGAGTGAGGFGGAGTGGSINTVGSDGTDGATTATVGSGVGGGSVLGGSTRSGGTGRNSLSIGGGGAASYTLASQNGGNGHAGAVILEY